MHAQKFALKTLCIVFITNLLRPIVSLNTSAFTANSYTTRVDCRFIGPKLEIAYVRSGIQCAENCGAHDQCNAFNVRSVIGGGSGGGENRRICELVKTDHSSLTDVREEAGWTFAQSKNAKIY